MTADPVRAALLRQRDLLHAATLVNDEALAAYDKRDDERLFAQVDDAVRRALGRALGGDAA